MEKELIVISEYCRQCNLDPDFLLLLEEEGLLEIHCLEGEKYIPSNQLYDLEQYTRMYYDLSINIPGIDAIRHLLGRLRQMQDEIRGLQRRLRLYEFGLEEAGDFE